LGGVEEAVGEAEAPQPRRAALPAEAKLRVVVIDDHPAIREALTWLLASQGIDVVGEAADGGDALAITRRFQPHVVLMDISMRRVGGVAATLLLRMEFPHLVIIALSVSESEDAAVGQMLAAGATTFVSKFAAQDALSATIRAACGRGTARG
jgi:DNA-binding NarL/FixJ family response regulator